ncbi:MAG: vWA domain-containing protein [Patescibacteria group bacterium]
MADIVKRAGGQGSLARKMEELNSSAKQSLPLPASATKSSGDLQVAFAFDTTCSMFRFFKAGKEAIKKIVAEVKAKRPTAEFCYIAYKNHGDEQYFGGSYPFFATEFSSNAESLILSLDRIDSSGGGDGLTAIEDVLHFLAGEIFWRPQATKVVVLIGDMPPHGVVDAVSQCPHEYVYRDETEKLKRKGVKIYSVHCFDERDLVGERAQKTQEFFKQIAADNGGKYLTMQNIDEVAQLLIGICMKETGHLSAFIRELKSRGQLTPATERKLRLLEGRRDGR